MEMPNVEFDSKERLALEDLWEGELNDMRDNLSKNELKLFEKQGGADAWYQKKLVNTSDEELSDLIDELQDVFGINDDDIDALSETIFDTKDKVLDYVRDNKIETTVIDISDFEDITRSELKFNKGGMVPDMDEQMSLFAYGGLAEEDAEMRRTDESGRRIEGVDPVSGNEVPLGGEPEGVRDDIDAKLSEGEYVIPEHIVDLYGVKFFENLIKRGDKEYAQMEKDGRFGNEPADDELPFDVSELAVEDDGEPVAMAEGGVASPNYNARGVAQAFGPTFELPDEARPPGQGVESRIYVNDAGQRRTFLFINGQPVQQIPKGFRPLEGDMADERESATTSTQENVTGDVDSGRNGIQDRRQEEIERERSEVDVTEWGLEDYENFMAELGVGDKSISQNKAAGYFGTLMGGSLMGGAIGLGTKITGRAALTQAEALVAAGYTDFQKHADALREAGYEPIEKGSFLDKILGVEFGNFSDRYEVTPSSNVVDTTPNTNVYDSLRRDSSWRDDTIQGSNTTQGEFADVTEDLTDMARNVASGSTSTSTSTRTDSGDTAQQAARDRLDSAERDAFGGVSTSDFYNKGGLAAKPKFKTRRKKSSGKAKGLAARKS